MPGRGVWHIPQVTHNSIQSFRDFCRDWCISINVSANCGSRDTCLSGHVADGNGEGSASHGWYVTVYCNRLHYFTSDNESQPTLLLKNRLTQMDRFLRFLGNLAF